MKVLYAQFRVYPDDVIHFQIPGQEINRSYGAVAEIKEPSIAKYVEDHYDELEKVSSFATNKQYIPCILRIQDDYTYVNLPNNTAFTIPTLAVFTKIKQDPWDYEDRMNDILKELLPEKKVTEQTICTCKQKKEEKAPEEEKEEVIEGKIPLTWEETEEELLLAWKKYTIHITPEKFEIYLK